MLLNLHLQNVNQSTTLSFEPQYESSRCVNHEDGIIPSITLEDLNNLVAQSISHSTTTDNHSSNTHHDSLPSSTFPTPTPSSIEATSGSGYGNQSPSFTKSDTHVQPTHSHTQHTSFSSSSHDSLPSSSSSSNENQGSSSSSVGPTPFVSPSSPPSHHSHQSLSPTHPHTRAITKSSTHSLKNQLDPRSLVSHPETNVSIEGNTIHCYESNTDVLTHIYWRPFTRV